MYNRKAKGWKAECTDEQLLNWCRESFNDTNMEARFLLADHLLAQGDSGKESAEAVWMMEQAAKADYPQAACAMGQMFQNGWAVGKDEKKAMEWYEKAVELGSQEAQAEIDRIRKIRTYKIAGAVATAVIVVFAIVMVATGGTLLAKWFPGLVGQEETQPGDDESEFVPGEVLVGDGTELRRATTFEEFSQELNDLINEYDDELVVSGQRSSNRLVLKFEGSVLDLSDYLADRVIAQDNNLVIIQFATEEEAERCLQELKENSQILFVETDQYEMAPNSKENETSDDGGSLPLSVYSKSARESISSSNDQPSYYSWGVSYMKMDEMNAWLQATGYSESVVVAVIDTGVKPNSESAPLIWDGFDAVEGTNGKVDTNGHGTHVSGTVMDATWGLDVTILPVRVFGSEDYTTTARIVMGLQYAVMAEPDVINMSLGGAAGPDHTGKDVLIREAVGKGIVVVATAGNGDEYGNPEDTAGKCPGHLDECIIVAAHSDSGRIASFSNYGDSVDVCAPGVDILSYGLNEDLVYMDGTSMAAPHVSALAAMLKLYMPDATSAQIEKYITDYCRAGSDSMYFGEGYPDASMFIEE